MRRILPVPFAWLFVSVFLVSVAPAAAEDAAFTRVLEPYLRIQSQLALDSMKGVKEDAEAVGRHARALGAPGAAVVDQAASVSRAADLAAARRAFGELSEALMAYADRNGLALPAGVEAKYCAMAKKSWFQQGAPVRNPYYGKAMLTCGEPRPRPATP